MGCIEELSSWVSIAVLHKIQAILFKKQTQLQMDCFHWAMLSG